MKDLQLLKGRLQCIVAFNPRVNCTFDTDCQGHLLSEIYYRLIAFLVKNKLSKKSTMKKDELMTIAIDYPFPQGSLIYAHYDEMMKKVI